MSRTLTPAERMPPRKQRLSMREERLQSRPPSTIASLGKGCAVGAAQLRHEFGRELHVGESFDHRPLEQRLLPLLAPDHVPGDGCARLDHLARPDLDVALDDDLFTDGGIVRDDHSFFQHGPLSDADIVADHGIADLGPFLDIDVVPDHAAVESYSRLDGAVAADHRVLDLGTPPRTWELSPITTVPSTPWCVSWSFTSAPMRRSLPTRSCFGSSILTSIWPLEDIVVRLPVGIGVADVAPVPLDREAEQRHPCSSDSSGKRSWEKSKFSPSGM